MVGMYDFGSLNDIIDVAEEFKRPEWENFDVEDDYQTALPFGFQPIPIHSSFTDDNFLLGAFFPETCPKVTERTNPDKNMNETFLRVCNLELKTLQSNNINVKEIIG